MVWDSSSTAKINSFLGSMNVDGIRVPVIAYAKKLFRPITPSVLVLDLVGGPAGDISPGLNDSMQEALAQRGAIVVKPAYAGTRHRSRYPAPDLDGAVREVVEIVRQLRRANPHSRLIVMGESLGGYIAAKAVSSQDDIPVDGLSLIVPLVYSPDQAIENFRRLARVSGKQFTPLWIRSDPSRSPVQPVDRSTRLRVSEYRAVSSMDLFEGYFPPEARTTGLLAYLTGKTRPPTLIAYGATDERVGIEALQAATSLPGNIHLLKLDHSGHAINAAAAERVATMMWSTFSLSSHKGRSN
ncbi:alpha/beta fold hydrolase [Sphingomonas aurantiaca]|uniref:alpha/beta fold hydrolase n=1 Tax=Sphingomonas aurantiaca TaxID=185949 RepID=UPI00335E8F0A